MTTPKERARNFYLKYHREIDEMAKFKKKFGPSMWSEVLNAFFQNVKKQPFSGNDWKVEEDIVDDWSVFWYTDKIWNSDTKKGSRFYFSFYDDIEIPDDGAYAQGKSPVLYLWSDPASANQKLLNLLKSKLRGKKKKHGLNLKLGEKRWRGRELLSASHEVSDLINLKQLANWDETMKKLYKRAEAFSKAIHPIIEKEYRLLRD